MIRYTLKCDNDHKFDGWFASADAFETQATRGLVSCAVCGSVRVEKSLMAPAVQAAPHAPKAPSGTTDAEKPRPSKGQLQTPASDLERAMAKMRAQVEANSDYVGKDFVTEARAIHDGSKPQRAIYGEARLDEARALAEDGVPVMPLPFRPSRKTN
ncbi:DUF1178 family protein [Rhodobacteraceae bacterium]|nr:DUF1178 family protein [Paracoccaceae bacterium]